MPGSNGLHLPESLIILLDIESGKSDTLATLPGAGRIEFEGFSFEVPFGSLPYIAVGGGRLWFGRSDRTLINGVSTSGGRLPPVLLPQPRVPVTREHRRLYRDFDAGVWSGISRVSQQVVSRHHARVEFPDSLPAFQGLLIDESGNLWVQEYQPRWSQGDYRWEVFDPSGRWITQVTVPFGLLSQCKRTSPYGGCRYNILEVGEGYLLTAHRDELGVQRLKKFRILKDE